MATNNKFIRKLHRELSANPKKSAFLGLLLLIAIWFWAPLVMKWTGNNTDAEAESVAGRADSIATSVNSKPVATSGLASNGTGNSNSATQPPAAIPHWHQLLHWIQKDPLMQSHVPQAGERDPFTSEKARLALQQKAQRSANPPVPELTPAEAGIALHSTVVGTRMKTALINGRAYHENQPVIAANGKDRFLLVEIRKDGIVLTRHGESCELKLKKMEFAGSSDE